jgi:exodeoxyribonuclease V beta subunit
VKAFDATTVALAGRNLVEASAGTGKTHAITTLFVRLLLETKLAIDQILVVTFTIPATAELRGRIRSRLRQALLAFQRGESPDVQLAALVAAERKAGRDPAERVPRLRHALQNVDEAAIFTIHGFCHRMLHDSAFDSDMEIDAELVTDLTALRDEVLCDYWAAELVDASRPLVRLLRDAKLEPTASRSLADKVTRNPTMPVLPQSIETSEPSCDPFNIAVERARKHWDSASISRLLSESKALSRRRYHREKQIPALIAAATDYFGGAPPDGPKDFGGLEKLTASYLADSTNKNFDGQQPHHPLFDACDALANEVEQYERAAKRHALAFKRHMVDYVRREIPRRKHDAGVLSFDDLLLRLEQALRGEAGQRLANNVRKRFPAALIDEFQDTDPVQYAIFDRIWSHGGVERSLHGSALYLIGDPKQAIYSFRGADVFAYMRAAADVRPAHRYTMGINWRSDPSLVDAVSTLFKRPEVPFLLQAIELPEVRARDGARDRLRLADDSQPASLQLLFVERAAEQEGKKKPAAQINKAVATEKLHHAIASDIADFLRSEPRIDGRRVQPGDIAVLTRSNVQAFSVQEGLRQLAVRSVVLGDQSVFEKEQPEARSLQIVLTAIAEPTHTAAVRAALTTVLIGKTANDLAAMEAVAETGQALGNDSWDNWIARFRDWNALWSSRGFVQMFRAFMQTTKLRQRLLTMPDGERRVTNILHLMELLHTAAAALHLGPRGLLAWLAQQRSNAKSRPEAAQIRLESDAGAVTITTVHKSKGLEYPIVYCPFLWDGKLLFQDEQRELLFHDPNDGNTLKLDLDPSAHPMHLARAGSEKLAESIRLLYVALTRAKHRCVVVWGAFKESETSALGYLLHPPPSAGGEPSAADTGSHLSGLDDARLRADLDALAAQSAGKIAVRTLDLDRRGAALQPTERDELPLQARRGRKRIDRWWRTASFTQLASQSSGTAVGDDEGRDRDSHELDGPTRGGSGDRPISLSDFPRGAKAGNFFHELFEELDFADLASSSEPAAELIAQRLANYGYDEDMRDVVLAALSEVVRTPLNRKGGWSLSDITRADRLDELEFHFPVAASGQLRSAPPGTQLELLFPEAGSESQAVMPVSRLTAKKLASAFADHPSPQLSTSYASRVERLGFMPLEGFIKGYIDVVFVRKGRWYLADYKSNHLGDQLDAYASHQLPEAMAHSHYYLQYHLYSLALHRYLKRRLPGYRYDKHFGGVYYLFIKGMLPEHASDAGVFFEKPPQARIAALDQLFRGAER